MVCAFVVRIWHKQAFSWRGSINGEVGWLTTKERHWFNMIRCWNRLINMDNLRLCKKVLLWDYSICGDKWSAEIKDVLSKIGMARSFENKEICNLNNTRVKLFFNYMRQNGSRKSQMYQKLRTYATYKTSYNVERYLTLNLKRNKRSVLAQFRWGTLQNM